MKSNYEMEKKPTVLSIVALGLFLICYSPALQRLVDIWASSDEYNHAFLVVPIIFFISWTKRGELVENSGRHCNAGLILAIFSSLFYLFALLTDVNTLIFASMLITIVGTIVYLAGYEAIGILLTPILLLVLLIPIPNQLYIQLTAPLKMLVSQISEIVVRFFDVPIFRQGNIMNVPGKTFEVVEACSGLRSMITLLSLSVLVGYFMLSRKMSKTILVVISIPIAVFVNIIRVTSMILLFHFFNLDFSEGALHTVLGMSIFILALMVLFFFQKGLWFWEAKSK